MVRFYLQLKCQPEHMEVMYVFFKNLYPQIKMPLEFFISRSTINVTLKNTFYFIVPVHYLCVCLQSTTTMYILLYLKVHGIFLLTFFCIIPLMAKSDL